MRGTIPGAVAVAAARVVVAAGARKPSTSGHIGRRSIGNASHRPIRQHTGVDQLGVDPLLLLDTSKESSHTSRS